MNFLAHILLSNNDPDIEIGNFIGDAIKGKDYKNYPIGLLKGMLLHRQIDSFTDIHPIVHQSKKRLHPRYGHYAGVIIDILYDHFLCVNWDTYSSIPIDIFISNFYKILENYSEHLPEEIIILRKRLISNDWFSNYKTIEGIGRVLNGMEKRIKHPIPLGQGIEDLKKNYKALNQDFILFFPELQKHTINTLQTLHLQYDD